jgi:hypothetical protein
LGFLPQIEHAGEIDFDVAAAFWCAFYVRMLSIQSRRMNASDVEEAISALCDFFNEQFHFPPFPAQEGQMGT